MEHQDCKRGESPFAGTHDHVVLIHQNGNVEADAGSWDPFLRTRIPATPNSTTAFLSRPEASMLNTSPDGLQAESSSLAVSQCKVLFSKTGSSLVRCNLILNASTSLLFLPSR